MAEDNTPLRTVWVACQRTAHKNALSTVLPLVLRESAPVAPQHRKFQAHRRKDWPRVRSKVCFVRGMRE